MSLRLKLFGGGVALWSSLASASFSVRDQDSEQVAQRTPGSALTRGMQLVYSSGGTHQPAWRVDSLDLSATFGGRTNCSVVRFGATDLRRTCAERDTLFTWNEGRQALALTRPIGTHMTMRVPISGGRTLAYETGAADTATISGMRIPFVHTTAITIDSTGKVVRRLRERFAISLGTALDGIFEAPADGGGWKVEREFVLSRIDGVGPAAK